MNQPWKPAPDAALERAALESGLDCSHAQAVFLDLLYEELSATEAVALKSHLAACPACQAEYQQLSGTAALLNRLPDQETRVDLAQLCLAATAEWQQSHRRWRMGALASCAAMVMVASSLALFAGWSDLQVDRQAGRLLLTWEPQNPPAAQPADGGPSPLQPEPPQLKQPRQPALQHAAPSALAAATKTMPVQRAEIATRSTVGRLPREWQDLGEYWKWRAQVLVGPELASAGQSQGAADLPTAELDTPTYRQMRDKLLLE